MKKCDLSLYFVTDPRSFGELGLVDTVRLAADGGVTVVQLREKNASKDEIREKAIKLINILSPLGIPLIINDYVDIAKEVGAQGVHLGKRDCNAKEARKILGHNSIIGLSIESQRDFERSEFELCDYVSASPVFPTPTKEDVAKAIGLDGLRKLRESCPIPLIAIGGINSKNVRLVSQTGMDGIAIVSDIMWASNPRKAASTLKSLFVRFRR